MTAAFHKPAWEQAATGPAAGMVARLAAGVPSLETARLLLRAPRIGDFDAYAEILMSDRARYMDGPFSRRDAWLDFTCAVSGWQLRGFGLWTIQHGMTGQTLGFVLIHLEYGDLEPELGYFLLSGAEGRGFAREACAAARDYAFAHLDLPALVSYIEPGNARSITLAEWLGATCDDTAPRPDPDVLVYRHTRPKRDN